MEEYNVITKYIELFENDSIGIWDSGKKTNNAFEVPDVSYSKTVNDFIQDFYEVTDKDNGIDLSDYRSILKENDCISDSSNVNETLINSLNLECLLALIMYYIRTERFSSGTLYSALEDETITNILKRIKTL